MGSCSSILALILLSFIVFSGVRPLPEDRREDAGDADNTEEEDREHKNNDFIMNIVYLLWALLVGGYASVLTFVVIRHAVTKRQKSRKSQGIGGKADAAPTRDSAPPDTIVSIPPESESPQTGPELSTIKSKGKRRVDNCSTRGMTDGTPWDAIVPISSSSSSSGSDSSEGEPDSSSEDDPNSGLTCEMCGGPGAATYLITEARIYDIYWD